MGKGRPKRLIQLRAYFPWAVGRRHGAVQIARLHDDRDAFGPTGWCGLPQDEVGPALQHATVMVLHVEVGHGAEQGIEHLFPQHVFAQRREYLRRDSHARGRRPAVRAARTT